MTTKNVAGLGCGTRSIYTSLGKILEYTKQDCCLQPHLLKLEEWLTDWHTAELVSGLVTESASRGSAPVAAISHPTVSAAAAATST